MKIWSNIEYVFLCLKDEKRTQKYQEAIKAIVKPGDVVLELGTGSGILSLFAAAAGAKKVYAVEITNLLTNIAKNNFKNNNFDTEFQCITDDARNIDIQQVGKVDVVICEMVTSGLISEMQIPVLHTLKQRSIITNNTRIIPQILDTYAQLVEVNYNFYDYEIRMPLFVNYFYEDQKSRFTKLSEKEHIFKIEFTDDFDEFVIVKIRIKANKTGTLNGVLLSTNTKFNEQLFLDDCISYCQPVILPMENIEVKANDEMVFSMQYKMGEGFDRVDYSCEKFKI